MSLTQFVAAIVEEDGSGTVETVLPQCPPGYTRAQVVSALYAAVRGGYLSSDGNAVYTPAPDLPDTPPRRKPRFPRVASVFELAEAMA